MTKQFKDLLYVKWALDFQNKVGLGGTLHDKLYYKYRLFSKDRDMVNDFGRWDIHQTYLLTWSMLMAVELNVEREEKIYLLNPVAYVHRILEIVYWFFLFTVYVLADFYRVYPKYDIPFEDLELQYLDFWLQSPRVIDDLLSFLITLDAPLLEDEIITGNTFVPGCRCQYYLMIREDVEHMSRQNKKIHLVWNILHVQPGINFTADEDILNFIIYYLKNRLDDWCLKEYAEVIAKRHIEIISYIFWQVIFDPYLEEVSSNGLHILYISRGVLRVHVGHLVEVHRIERRQHWEMLPTEEKEFWLKRYK